MMVWPFVAAGLVWTAAALRRWDRAAAIRAYRDAERARARAVYPLIRDGRDATRYPPGRYGGDNPPPGHTGI